jgi:tetratricopeptide (TPR) repeat protein
MKQKLLITSYLIFSLIIKGIAQVPDNVLVGAFARSIEAEKRKDYQSAINELNNFYEGKSYEMNLRLGWLYFKKDDYNKSIEYYMLAKTLNPKSIEPLAGLIFPYAGLSNTQMLLDLYMQILNIDPMDINSNYQLGFIQYNANAKDKAKGYFEKIIKLYPSGYEPYLYDAYTKITNPDELKTRNVEVYKKSFELEYSKKYTEAIEVLKPIYDKNNYDVNLRLGWLYYLSKQYVEATNYYQNAIDIKPEAFEPRYGIVFPSLAMGNSALAQNQYKKLLEISPKNTYANYGYGLGFYNQKDYDNAQKYFQSVVDLYPFNYDALLMLGWTYLKLNNKEMAKTYFTKTLFYSPQDKSAKEGLVLTEK